jgi:hypothetical protein
MLISTALLLDSTYILSVIVYVLRQNCRAAGWWRVKYYVTRSKNEVLCAEADSLAVERN